MSNGNGRGISLKAFSGMAGMLVLALAGFGTLLFGGILPALADKRAVRMEMAELRQALAEAAVLKPLYAEVRRVMDDLREPLRDTRLVRPVELSGMEAEEELLRAQLAETGLDLRQFSVQLGELEGNEQRAEVDLRILFLPDRLGDLLSELEGWSPWRRVNRFVLNPAEAGQWELNCSLEVLIR